MRSKTVQRILDEMEKDPWHVKFICLGYFTRPYIDALIKIIKNSLKK